MSFGAPATRLCVARHGETDWNIEEILQGWLDIAINDNGRQQAREFAAACAETGFVRIYSSPLRRALETAEIIADELHLASPLCHEGLKERNFGVVQGMPKVVLAKMNPLLLEEIRRRNPACEFEYGESMDHFASRVLNAIIDIGERHAGERILAITHGWVMDVIARHIGNLDRSAILDRKTKNGEFLWLEVGERSIVRLAVESG